MRTLRTAATVAVVIGTAGLLAGCSNDPDAYADATEDFLEDEDGDVAAEYDQVFREAQCEDPDSTEVGSRYTCTAVGDGDQTWIFDVEIDGEDSFVVQGGAPQE